jgi:putative transposase
MPWDVRGVEEERVRFISQWREHEWSFAELCRQFGVSRKTGYKWRRRREGNDPGWFRDRSRATRSLPHALKEPMVQRLLQARRAHPTWGAGKLRDWLQAKHPRTRFPAKSSIGELLKREGLTVRRRRRQHTPPCSQPFASCDAPNAVWTADLKGWFCTQDGVRCHPFTLQDAYSRFLLRCQALLRTDAEALQPLFEAAFRQFGLPCAIRTDNGPPFASVGLGGLAPLSIWWVKLGIVPERIQPGHPEQNGRHERLHRTLSEATRPPQPNRTQQQRAFDRFTREYNSERPHEALCAATPASVYTPSARRYPLRLVEMDYPPEMTVRRVRRSGEIKWRGRTIYLSQALAGERVGLQPVDEQVWRLHFGPVELALLDERRWKVVRPKRRRRPRPR